MSSEWRGDDEVGLSVAARGVFDTMQVETAALVEGIDDTNRQLTIAQAKLADTTIRITGLTQHLAEDLDVLAGMRQELAQQVGHLLNENQITTAEAVFLLGVSGCGEPHISPAKLQALKQVAESLGAFRPDSPLIRLNGRRIEAFFTEDAPRVRVDDRVVVIQTLATGDSPIKELVVSTDNLVVEDGDGNYIPASGVYVGPEAIAGFAIDYLLGCCDGLREKLLQSPAELINALASLKLTLQNVRLPADSRLVEMIESYLFETLKDPNYEAHPEMKAIFNLKHLDLNDIIARAELAIVTGMANLVADGKTIRNMIWEHKAAELLLWINNKYPTKDQIKDKMTDLINSANRLASGGRSSADISDEAIEALHKIYKRVAVPHEFKA